MTNSVTSSHWSTFSVSLCIRVRNKSFVTLSVCEQVNVHESGCVYNTKTTKLCNAHRPQDAVDPWINLEAGCAAGFSQALDMYICFVAAVCTLYFKTYDPAECFGWTIWGSICLNNINYFPRQENDSRTVEDIGGIRKDVGLFATLMVWSMKPLMMTCQ